MRELDALVQLAARVHGKAVNPLTAFRGVNVEGSLHVACQATAAVVNCFVFVSSVKVNRELM